MDKHQKIVYKRLIFENLFLTYKTHDLHEKKILLEKMTFEEFPRNERRKKERENKTLILNIEDEISELSKKLTELSKKLTDSKVIQLIDNSVDLYNDFTDLFVKAYFTSEDRVELKASILKKINGVFEKYE